LVSRADCECAARLIEVLGERKRAIMRESLRADFARAVTRLDEALAVPKDPIARDSAIQRFEISLELCWKSFVWEPSPA